MKEIIYDFPRSRAKNAQHVQFATDVLAAVTEEVATAQGFASQRSAFATATTAEQDCFKVSRKYVDTTEVASRDSVRDNVALFYRGIARVNAEYGLTAETRKAGQLVFDLFNNAGDVVRMDYASETATLTDLVGKMRETMYAEALTAIGIESAPDDIEEANDAFNAIYLQRSAAERDRAFAADMKTLRPATDEAFDTLAYAINALFAVNEMVTNDEGKRTTLTKVIDDVNAIVVRFRKTIGQKSPSGSSSTDEPGEEPGGGEETDSPSVI
ncbi:MAG TPA: hypothetical protein H9848_09190 [Candidatus Parabacteroides intestinigallinarum]|uniref:Uncharacterized protein n=1 Tax=Candidatus Parabacteroides intestinigallinarum TaxID=2838722 RepID=A0A9D1XS59_9BACT|nr:hypothetical protein [Candidatus Parabacteroides intestinigallinarum]